MSNLNPFVLLDSLLEDYASPAIRRLLHAIILLAVALVAIWQAAEGDWEKFALSVLASLYAAANKANTDPNAGMEDGQGFYDSDVEAGDQ